MCLSMGVFVRSEGVCVYVRVCMCVCVCVCVCLPTHTRTILSLHRISEHGSSITQQGHIYLHHTTPCSTTVTPLSHHGITTMTLV
jgi:hypothetical protein